MIALQEDAAILSCETRHIKVSKYNSKSNLFVIFLQFVQNQNMALSINLASSTTKLMEVYGPERLDREKTDCFSLPQLNFIRKERRNFIRNFVKEKNLLRRCGEDKITAEPR